MIDCIMSALEFCSVGEGDCDCDFDGDGDGREVSVGKGSGDKSRVDDAGACGAAGGGDSSCGVTSTI